MTTVLEPTGRAAATGPCAPADVTLHAAAVTVGAAVPGFHTEVHGLAVDDRFVYATCGTTGIQNGHETAGPGELVVFDRAALRAALLAGGVPPERRVTVGRQPRSVASLVRPDYQRVFVVNYHQDSFSLTVLNRSNLAPVAEVSIGMTPIDVAVHTGRGRAYVTDGYHGIRSIDARTGAEITAERIEIGREVVGLAVDEAADLLFVVHNRQYDPPPVDQLVVVDLKTRTVVKRVNFPAHSNPRDVALDSAHVYVGFINSINGPGTTGVLRLSRANLAAPPTRLGTTAGVWNVATARSGATSLVYATVSGQVQVLDPAAEARVGSSGSLAPKLGPVAVDPASGEVYAGDLADGRMFRIAPVSAAGPIGQHPLVADGTLGAALEAPRPAPDGQAQMQRFAHGLAVATADYGAVVLRHGHDSRWLSGASGPGQVAARATAAAVLGNPAANTATAGGATVSYFENGAVITRVDAGVARTITVSGAIWQRYRDGGEVTGGYGLPLADEVPSPAGGGYQEFGTAVLFHRGAGDAATVVWRGPVWDALIARYGGPQGGLGFPAEDLTRRYHPDLGLPSMEWVRFENSALIWIAGDDAVHQLIPGLWDAWHREGGPDGPLGLPITGTRASAHDPDSPVRFVDFRTCTLVQFPPGHPLRPTAPEPEYTLVTSLQLHVTAFRAEENDQNNPDNPPDPYIDHWVVARHAPGEQPYFRWEGRLAPAGGHWQDVRDIPLRGPITIDFAEPVRGDTTINVAFHCWDHDSPDGDDILGRIEHSYSVANLWGLREVSDEHHDKTDDGEFFAWYTMRPKGIPATLEGNFRGRFFWQFKNPDTAVVSTRSYERAFTDIEPGLQFHIEPGEWLHEIWESFFYNTFFKEIAKPGNCYGLCVEAIEAFRGRSRYQQPIFQFGHPRWSLGADHKEYGWPDLSIPADAELMEEINTRHGTQLGDRVVRWAADHILATIGGGGSINDGVEIFDRAKRAFDRGDWPVMNMIKEWDSGGHTVLPIRFVDDGTHDLEIWLADPSKPPLPPDPPGPLDVTDGKHVIFIDRHNGSWAYRQLIDGNWVDVGTYNSQAPRWLMYVPESRFSRPQRSPSTEFAIAAGIAVGVAAMVASPFLMLGDADTHQISDASGRTLYQPGLGRAPKTPLDLRADPADRIPGLQRIPLLGGEDAPVRGEFHYSTGAHESLVHDVVPRHPGGSYVWGMRHGAMAVRIAAPTDGHADRIQSDRLGTAGRSVSFARRKTLPAKPIGMAVEAFPRMPLPSVRVPADQRIRQYRLDELTVVGGQQVVVRTANGGAELQFSSYGAPASFALRMRGRDGTGLSRVRRITVAADRTAVLRPAGWSVPELDGAPLPVEIRESPDGPRVSCYEAPPEGPAPA